MTNPRGSLLLVATALTFLCAITLGERSTSGENSEVDTPEFTDYEYQRDMPKRAALLLDRLLVALQKAVENDEIERERSKPYVRSIPEYSDLSDSRMHLADEKTMDLQRRGQAKGRIYWRCYFNAVTCFKRK